MTRSHCMASSQPPPSAKPATAATTGLRAAATRCQVAAKSARKTSVNPLPAISLISAPAAKALSEPVMMMQPTLLSASNASMARASSRINALLRALSACGRLSLIRPTRPRVSTMMVSLMDSSQKLLLAHRTIEGRAAVLDDALDRTAAARGPAWLAGAIVNAEVMLKHAELAVREPVIAQRRAAVLDRLCEHRLDAVDQPRGAFVWCAVALRKCRRPPLRR